MTTLTVTYNLPEEMSEFGEAHNAHHAWAALREIDNVCRTQLKHGSPDNGQLTVERIREIALDALRSIE